MRKRFHSVIVAIARDEDAYIFEWVAYHLAIGFEHIWIYDNQSRIPIRRTIGASSARRHVTVVDWPDIPGENTQFAAYADFVRKHRSRSEWVAVIDLDEFICLKRHDHIRHFLDGFHDATSVGINWRFFGSSGQVAQAPGLLMERFTRASRTDDSINAAIKSISRTKNLGILTPHYAEHHGGNRPYTCSGSRFEAGYLIPCENENFDVAQINHYFVKSRFEWAAKVARGYSWVDEDRRSKLELYDRNECEDLSILRWKSETERLMTALKATRWARFRSRLARLLARARGPAAFAGDQ